MYYTEHIINYHRMHFYYNTSHSIAHYLHIILKHIIILCHNIIAFHSILITRMTKPARKTKKTIQARLGSLTKAGTKGKKRSASSKNIAPPISNKQKKSLGPSSNITNLAAASIDNGTDSIVDQGNDVVLAGAPNHSFLPMQILQGDDLDDDLDDDNENNDNHVGVEYNATLYDGRENSVAAVHLSRLSASPSLADVDASIVPDLSTLSMNGLIAAANEALRVQKSLECEVAALQETMLSMRNQSQINSSAISGYQEGALVVGKSLVEKEWKDCCNISSIMVHYVVKEVFRTQK